MSHLQFVNELREGEYVHTQLAIRKKYGIREYRNRFGKFFVLEAGDRTGSILVKYWGRDTETTEKLYEELKEGDVIEVTGNYRKDEQTYISVDADYDSFMKIESYDSSRFVPVSENRENTIKEILKIIESVDEVYMSKLLELFFKNDSFLHDFEFAPGSAYGAYSYLGGLAEHTLNVTKACAALAEIYNLNRDFLITAGVLHDIGRIESYEVDTSIKMRDRAKLLGHTVLSYQIVEEKMREIVDFPEDTRDALLHAIIAHHSPIVDNVPQRIRTREAYILFYVDMLDLSLKEFETEGEDEWSYSKKLGREIYTGTLQK